MHVPVSGTDDCGVHAITRDLSLQACSSVTLEDVTVVGECCPFGCDYSLNVLVLIFVSGAVSLSQVDVAFNVLDLNVVDITKFQKIHCEEKTSQP